LPSGKADYSFARAIIFIADYAESLPVGACNIQPGLLIAEIAEKSARGLRCLFNFKRD
jgi:hypothetical protein